MEKGGVWGGFGGWEFSIGMNFFPVNISLV